MSAPHELKPATLDQQASPKVHRPLAPGGGKGGSIFVVGVSGTREWGPDQGGGRCVKGGPFFSLAKIG